MAGNLSHRRPCLIAAALLLLVYLGILAWLPRNVFWHPDEGAKFFILHAIHWDGGLTYTLPYRGVRLDPEFHFYPRRSAPGPNLYPAPMPDGSVEVNMPVWFPWLATVPYRLLGLTGLYLIPLLSGFFTAIVAGWMTYRFAPGLAPLAILSVGLATPVCFYSFCFWEHTLATLLATSAGALLIHRERKPLLLTAAIVLLTALTLLLRIEMLAFALALAAAWAVTAIAHRRHADAASLPSRVAARRLAGWAVVLATVLLAVSTLAMWFPLLPARHIHRLVTLPQKTIESIQKLRSLGDSLVAIWINFPGSQSAPLASAWAWAGLLGVVACLVSGFVQRRILQTTLLSSGLLLLFIVSLQLLLSSQSYRAVHGVFPISPASAAFAYPLADALRRRDYPLLTLVTVALVYLLLSTLAVFMFYYDPISYNPALEWGPRLLLTLYPLALVLTLAGLQNYWQTIRSRWHRYLCAAVVACGLCLGLEFQSRGLQMLYNTRSQLALAEQMLPAGGPVVTNVWWLASALAPYFVEHEVYYAPRPENQRQWIDLATRRGVDSFVFIGFAPPDAAALGRMELREVRGADYLMLFKFHQRAEP